MMINEPTRVAVVVAQFVTAGTKSYIMNYYRNIDRHKIQFDFIVNNTSDGNYQEIINLGGRVYEITPAMKNPVKNVIETYKILKEHKYRVILGLTNALNVFPMFAAWCARTPVRISENLSTAHPSEKKKTFVKNILRPFSTWFPNRLAANSELAAKWLFGNKKCLILRNGIDLQKFNYNETLRKSTRNELGLNEEFVIGHIGRFDYQKNHNFLIDVFKSFHDKHPSAKLLLVGYGELKEQIDNKINRLNLRDAVIDCGATEDIAKLYNAMDCFVLPSLYEGLPVVGIEAQATGLPCIFSSEVTKEAQIIEEVSFISLDEDISIWVKKIEQFMSFERKIVTDEIRQAGYDIKTESVNMVKLCLGSK